MDILFYILIILICFGMSFLAKGLIDKFCIEDELKEQFLKDNDERINNSNEKEKKEIQNQLKKLKKPIKLKFDWRVFLILCVVEILLYTFVSKESLENFIIYSLINFIVTICAFTDIKRCIIPDELNLIGFIIGIIHAFLKLVFSVKDGIDLILGGIIGFGIFILIYFLSLIVFKKEGMGGGDIKLMGVLGLFFGIKSIIQIFVLSFLFASIISIFLLLSKIKKKTDYIAFGPFIVLATYVTMFISGSYTYNQIYRYMMYH